MKKSFQEGLQKKYNITEVVQAFWIQPKNSILTDLTPYLITFSQSQTPATIYVSGERPVKVRPYLQRPLFCSKCLEHTHSAKRCQNPGRCIRCGEDYQIAECENATLTCYHCNEGHRAGHHCCKKQKQEDKICRIWYREKVNYNIAEQKYFNRETASTSYLAD